MVQEAVSMQRVLQLIYQHTHQIHPTEYFQSGRQAILPVLLLPEVGFVTVPVVPVVPVELLPGLFGTVVVLVLVPGLLDGPSSSSSSSSERTL